MKRLLMGLLCVAWSAAALAAGPSKVRERVQASMLLTGTIVVAPDGTVSSYVIDQAGKLPSPVTGLIANNIPRWTFKPTVLDGRPVAAESPMSFRVVAKPLGDDKFSIAISGAQFGKGAPGESITYKRRIAPTYPRAALYGHASGTVYLILRVGRQGQVEDVVPEQVNMTMLASDAELERWRKVLAQSAMQAARRWTFNPPTSGKQVDAKYWVARVPVNFSLRPQLNSDRYGTWQAYIPGPHQPVPWFDDTSVASASADAVPDGDLLQVDQGLRLTSPLNGG